MGWFRTKSSGVTTPDYTGLQLQTSVNTLPVPIVWGKAKLAPNVIWYGNFQTQHGSSGSGKGFFRSSSSTTTYSADVIMALCEGPIAGLGLIWKGQSTYTLASLGFSLFYGTTPQAVWGYLAANDPAQALAYQGTAYVCAANYPLGSSASLTNHNFEVEGVFYQTGVNGIDADPALVISDFLTNPQYGVGFPGASINATTLFGASGDASLQTYCRALGLAFSPALTNAEPASNVLHRWLQILNCAAVWSGGQLKFIPYGDSPVAGNGYAYTPNLAPIYSLNDNDFVDPKGNKDPVEVARVDPFSLPTIQRLEVADRANQYSLVPIEARDQSQIELYGPRVGSSVSAREICDVSVVAPTVAQALLQRALYQRARFKFQLSWEYCLLDPMDVVAITDANLGLSAFPARIVSLEEDDKGVISVVAEELTVGVGTPALYPTSGSTSVIPNQGALPSSVNAPLIYEPPPALTGGTPQIWVAASGGVGGVVDPNWGGANVWVSLDNLTYMEVATISQPAKQGLLTAGLAAATGYDTIDALAVNLAESGATLSSAGAIAAQQGVTLALVDGELLAYANAALSGPSAYSLTGLARALFGSTAAAHASGAPFSRLDAAVVKYALPANFVGKPLYFKFQSFNVFGAGLQSLAACLAYPYTPTGYGSASPIAAQLASGLPTDLGSTTQAPALSDDFGAASGAFLGAIDLGATQ